jgi:hypothetical protein
MTDQDRMELKEGDPVELAGVKGRVAFVSSATGNFDICWDGSTIVNSIPRNSPLIAVIQVVKPELPMLFHYDRSGIGYTENSHPHVLISPMGARKRLEQDMHALDRYFAEGGK